MNWRKSATVVVVGIGVLLTAACGTDQSTSADSEAPVDGVFLFDGSKEIDASLNDLPLTDAPAPDAERPDLAFDAYCSADASQSCYTGPPGTEGVGECRAGVQICASGLWSNCSGETLPTVELCDGKDNDCDGVSDEDYPDLGKTCESGIGECATAGVHQCKTDGSGIKCSATAGTPSPETCDNKDNDCDGQVDEDASGNPLTQSCYSGPAGTEGVGECKAGQQTCTNGAWLSCLGQILPTTTDICDSKDNDCDGQVDEDASGNPLTAACYTGPVGTVGKGVCILGKKTCLGGAWGSCQGQVLPSAESCNGLDDDCDGSTDEDFGNLGQVCSVGVGACQATSTYKCKLDGSATECPATPGTPSPEVCDNKDNDCDGQVDEDFSELGMPCWVGVGGCQRESKFACKVDESGTECPIAPGTPQPETCNGADDDCDGTKDEGSLCPSGQVCIGACVSPSSCALYQWNGHTYGICTSLHSWSSAQAICLWYGAHLATINSAAEDNFLRPFASSSGYDGTWIGFNDIAQEGVWVWESGEPVTYTGWASGEPNDQYGSEDCGHYYYKSGYLWNDAGCNDNWPFICEWDFLF